VINNEGGQLAASVDNTQKEEDQIEPEPLPPIGK